jgi:two-component system catabolic regulation response regulator CreB
VAESTAQVTVTSPPEGHPPLVVDDERKSITYFGPPLDLSRYEYPILKLLISRPGRVFSRNAIMGDVWDEPEASLERTVNAHVEMIRSKPKAVAPDVEAIHTHRGEGYSLAEDW